MFPACKERPHKGSTWSSSYVSVLRSKPAFSHLSWLSTRVCPALCHGHSEENHCLSARWNAANCLESTLTCSRPSADWAYTNAINRRHQNKFSSSTLFFEAIEERLLLFVTSTPCPWLWPLFPSTMLLIGCMLYTVAMHQTAQRFGLTHFCIELHHKQLHEII